MCIINSSYYWVIQGVTSPIVGPTEVFISPVGKVESTYHSLQSPLIPFWVPSALHVTISSLTTCFQTNLGPISVPPSPYPMFRHLVLIIRHSDTCLDILISSPILRKTLPPLIYQSMRISVPRIPCFCLFLDFSITLLSSKIFQSTSWALLYYEGPHCSVCPISVDDILINVHICSWVAQGAKIS